MDQWSKRTQLQQGIPLEGGEGEGRGEGGEGGGRGGGREGRKEFEGKDFDDTT